MVSCRAYSTPIDLVAGHAGEQLLALLLGSNGNFVCSPPRASIVHRRSVRQSSLLSGRDFVAESVERRTRCGVGVTVLSVALRMSASLWQIEMPGARLGCEVPGVVLVDRVAGEAYDFIFRAGTRYQVIIAFRW